MCGQIHNITILTIIYYSCNLFKTAPPHAEKEAKKQKKKRKKYSLTISSLTALHAESR